jgi:hypothetical protein
MDAVSRIKRAASAAIATEDPVDLSIFWESPFLQFPPIMDKDDVSESLAFGFCAKRKLWCKRKT